jgi:thermostable 8-oxoguanine DNA glycosylase
MQLMQKLRAPHSQIVPGVPLGRADEVFSPAFWGDVARAAERRNVGDIRLGASLTEEVVACLLGGFGMPAEMGLAAFDRLRRRRLLYPGVGAAVLEAALSEPFAEMPGAPRYRFPRQKAGFVAASLELLPQLPEPACDLAFRDDLATLPGVGLKTASWVVRNVRHSNQVAVLDVHIVRAGRYIGLFSATMDPARHYRTMEQRFIGLASALNVRVPWLDMAIWQVMRSIGHLMPNATYSSHFA